MINRCNMLSGCVKPTYLVIFKGDDTDFPGNQEIEIVIDTEMDLTGLKAHFRFMDFTQDFNEIPEDKKLNIVIPHDKTSAFPIGASDATLFLEDQSGKIRTVSNRIHIFVTNSVHEAYENEDTKSVTVTVKGTVTWDMIEDKPTIPEPSDTDPLMDGEASAGTSDDFSRGDHAHPSDKSKLDGAATYPAWDETHQYEDNDTVSYGGRIWFADGTPTLGVPPGEDAAWNETSIGTYLSLKQNALTSEQIGYINSVPSKAPLASPALTGTPTAPTAASGTNTTQIATTAFVQDALNGKRDVTDLGVRGAPHGEGSWFVVDGVTFEWDDVDAWKDGNGTVITRMSNNLYDIINSSGQENEFSLSSDFTASFDIVGVRHNAIGYVDMLAQVSQIPDVTGKADKVSGATEGNLASLTATGNLANSGVKPSDFAAKTDLPYRLVTLTASSGAWTVSGLDEGWTYGEPEFSNGTWSVGITSLTYFGEATASGDAGDLSVSFSGEIDGESFSCTFSRPYANGASLLDRASNKVSVSSDTTLTFPAALSDGLLRDFVVRLSISGSTLPEVTFVANGNEQVTFVVKGNDPSTAEFPKPDAEGTWIYAFSEDAQGEFCVWLDQVVSVSQGGS